MAVTKQIVTGLDIGTTNTSIVVSEIGPDGRLDVIGVGTAPSKGLRKGVVINIEATVSSIEAALNQAETMSGVEVSNVFASISGAHIKGFGSHGIVGIKNREVSHDDIERVIEAAKAVAIPLDREVLHVLPQEFIIDEQDGIKEPLGISGVRMEAKVHIITGAVASAQNIVKCANRCGLTVNDIVFSALASGRAVASAEEQELGICVVDIGGGTTDIAVFQNGAIRFSAVLPVGGNHITNDIASGLRTPVASAEEIKCLHGSAMTGLVGNDETLEVPSTGDRSSRVISKVILAEIIEPRVVEIFSLVAKELSKADMEKYLTGGIILTGGGSNLSGVVQVAEKIFDLPVRLGMPRGLSGLTDLVNSPEYAVSAGLVHYGVATRKAGKVSSGKNFLSRNLKKVGNWLGSHF